MSSEVLWFVVYGLLFMVCCLWFVVYGLLFMVCCLWFVVYGLWVNWRVFFPYKNPEPRTPNPEPRTPNPEPRTPNPEPRTPNPEPRTPNPYPSLCPKMPATCAPIASEAVAAGDGALHTCMMRVDSRMMKSSAICPSGLTA